MLRILTNTLSKLKPTHSNNSTFKIPARSLLSPASFNSTHKKLQFSTKASHVVTADDFQNGKDSALLDKTMAFLKECCEKDLGQSIKIKNNTIEFHADAYYGYLPSFAKLINFGIIKGTLKDVGIETDKLIITGCDFKALQKLKAAGWFKIEDKDNVKIQELGFKEIEIARPEWVSLGNAIIHQKALDEYYRKTNSHPKGGWNIPTIAEVHQVLGTTLFNPRPVSNTINPSVPTQNIKPKL